LNLDVSEGCCGTSPWRKIAFLLFGHSCSVFARKTRRRESYNGAVLSHDIRVSIIDQRVRHWRVCYEDNSTSNLVLTDTESDMATPTCTKDAPYPCRVPYSVPFSQKITVYLPKKVWCVNFEVHLQDHHHDGAR